MINSDYYFQQLQKKLNDDVENIKNYLHGIEIQDVTHIKKFNDIEVNQQQKDHNTIFQDYYQYKQTSKMQIQQKITNLVDLKHKKYTYKFIHHMFEIFSKCKKQIIVDKERIRILQINLQKIFCTYIMIKNRQFTHSLVAGMQTLNLHIQQKKLQEYQQQQKKLIINKFRNLGISYQIYRDNQMIRFVQNFSCIFNEYKKKLIQEKVQKNFKILFDQGMLIHKFKYLKSVKKVLTEVKLGFTMKLRVQSQSMMNQILSLAILVKQKKFMSKIVHQIKSFSEPYSVYRKEMKIKKIEQSKQLISQLALDYIYKSKYNQIKQTFLHELSIYAQQFNIAKNIQIQSSIEKYEIKKQKQQEQNEQQLEIQNLKKQHKMNHVKKLPLKIDYLKTIKKNSNQIQFEKELTQELLYPYKPCYKLPKGIKSLRAHDDSKINILENLILTYWGIKQKFITKKGLFKRRFISALKFKIIKNWDSTDEQKERINNLMILAPIQIMNLELENSEQNLQKTLILLQNDQKLRDGHDKKIFENTESLYLIQLCHLWLAWTSLIAYQRNYTYNPITLTANYLGSFLNYSVTMQYPNYYIKQIQKHKNIYDELEVLILACEILFSNNLEKTTLLTNSIRQNNYKTILQILKFSQYLDSQNVELQKEAKDGYTQMIKENKFVYLCSTKLFMFFKQQQKFDLQFKLYNFIIYQNLDCEQHMELIWSYYIKSARLSHKFSDQIVIKFQEFIQSNDQNEYLYLHYQYARYCIKYDIDSLSKARTSLDFVLEQLDPVEDHKSYILTKYWLGKLYIKSLYHNEAQKIFQSIIKDIKDFDDHQQKIQFIDQYLIDIESIKQKLIETQEYLIKQQNSLNSQNDDYIFGYYNQGTFDSNLVAFQSFDLYLFQIISIFDGDVQENEQSGDIEKLVKQFPSRIESWFFYWLKYHQKHKQFNKIWLYAKTKDQLNNMPYIVFKQMKQEIVHIESCYTKYLGLDCQNLWILNKMDYGLISFKQTIQVMKIKTLLRSHALKSLKIAFAEITIAPGTIFAYFYSKIILRFKALKLQGQSIYNNQQYKVFDENLTYLDQDKYKNYIDDVKFTFIEKVLLEFAEKTLSKILKAKSYYLLAEGSYIMGEPTSKIAFYYKRSYEIFKNIGRENFLTQPHLIITSDLIKPIKQQITSQ